MKTTFINCNKEDRKAFRQHARQHLESRKADFEFFQSIGGQSYDDLALENESLTPEMQKITEIGDFYDYGLSIDYVAPGTFNNQREGYLRYQLSWGGPSEEIRFYASPGARQAYKIEFVYLNWGTGVGFNVTHEPWAEWLFQWLDTRL